MADQGAGKQWATIMVLPSADSIAVLRLSNQSLKEIVPTFGINFGQFQKCL
jgi:hypothetical protein